MALLPEYYTVNVSRGYKVPSYRFPSSSDGQSINSPRMRSVACTVNALKEEWHRQRVTSGRWGSYFGDQSTGTFVHVPSPGTCKTNYDARMRPWYSSAATGPKDIVIVLDRSGSMHTAGRMTAAKNAAKAVVDTLNHADYATIVAFSDSATSASDDTNQLVRADKAGREKLKTWIDQLFPVGLTNYEAAMTKGFAIMDASKRAGVGSGCGSNTMMFLSDGDITLGAKGEAFLAKLKILNHADFRMRLFTYSFGFTSPMMTQMACAHNGLFQTIPDENPELLKETMAKYYEFFAAGI